MSSLSHSYTRALDLTFANNESRDAPLEDQIDE